MKTTNIIGRSLRVSVRAKCNRFFHSLLLALLCLAGAPAMTAQAQAQALPEGVGLKSTAQLETAGNTLWVNLRVASLSRQITLCPFTWLGYGDGWIVLARQGVSGEYEWRARINADGVGGDEADVVVYSSDPQDPDELHHTCVPHAADTARALKAELIDLRPDASGNHPRTRTALPLVVDFARNTLSVGLDRGLPELAGLSPAATFDFRAAAYWDDGWDGGLVIDDAAQLRLGSGLPVSAADASNDTNGFIGGWHCDPGLEWCQLLDIVGVSLADQAEGRPAGTIDAGYTGAWYDPAQSGHGIFIEVLPDSRLLAYWFTFDPTGTQQAWFGGVGSYSGATATITDVSQTTGGRWIPNFDRTQVVNRPWGSFTLTFTDCNHGRVDFNSTLGYGSGGMNLTRLTLPAGLTCP